MRRGRSQRLSRLQRIILEELSRYREPMVARPEELSLRVARQYDPTKVWRLENLREKPDLYLLARCMHRKTEMVREGFSASFSRSLRNLEKKGLVQLVRGKHKLWLQGGTCFYYRIKTPQPRISLIVHHKSPYFRHQEPDVEFMRDILTSVG